MDEPREPEPVCEPDAQRWRRVQSLFHRARELEAPLRPAFLRRHCGDDAALASEVEGLLAEADGDASVDDGARAGPHEDLSGRRLGDYELVRILGEGSMGVIYEARQRSVQRAVALKVLRAREELLGAGGAPEAYERVAARFVDEAEVLGRLDHPGIVPIHEFHGDAERAPDGTSRAWFTMRLVQGEDFRAAIARARADASGVELHRALQVVVRVCETMAFAHQRGVLHRDLKPSHVMVGAYGEVYILDWGLARRSARPEVVDIRIREAEAPDAGSPLRTIDGDVIGTPAYMPPEQALGRLEHVDERSDVYAVGAILHHLATGHPPYGPDGSPRAVLGRVRAGPPPALLESDPHADPALAAICEKAMAREPAGRYPSMDALAADLRALLENRVVAAHRTGVGAELAKWVQRNRALAAALALVLLVLGAWAASVVVLRARTAERLRAKADELQEANAVAVAEREQADAEAAVATAIGGFLDELLRSADPERAQGDDVTVRAALDAAAARLEGAFDDQPEVEAALRVTIGATYRELGRVEEAEFHLWRALDARRALHEAGAPELLEAQEEYALALREAGRAEEAEELLRATLAARREAQGGEGRDALRCAERLAAVLCDLGRADEAEPLARETLAVQERRFGLDDEDTLSGYGTLGTALYRLGELDQAERLFTTRFEAFARLRGEAHSSTLLAALDRMVLLDALGRTAEALEFGEAYLERVVAVFGPEHRNSLVVSANLGLMLCNQGRMDEGLERLEATLAREREALGSDHPETMLTLFNLTETKRRSGLHAGCADAYRELLAWQRAHLPREHQDFRDSLWGLADVLREADDPAGAVPLLEELLEIELDTSGPGHDKTRAVEAAIDACVAAAE